MRCPSFSKLTVFLNLRSPFPWRAQLSLLEDSAPRANRSRDSVWGSAPRSSHIDGLFVTRCFDGPAEFKEIGTNTVGSGRKVRTWSGDQKTSISIKILLTPCRP